MAGVDRFRGRRGWRGGGVGDPAALSFPLQISNMMYIPLGVDPLLIVTTYRM